MEKQKEDKVFVDKNSFERLQKGNLLWTLGNTYSVYISISYLCVY